MYWLWSAPPQLLDKAILWERRHSLWITQCLGCLGEEVVLYVLKHKKVMSNCIIQPLAPLLSFFHVYINVHGTETTTFYDYCFSFQTINKSNIIYYTQTCLEMLIIFIQQYKLMFGSEYYDTCCLLPTETLFIFHT